MHHHHHQPNIYSIYLNASGGSTAQLNNVTRLNRLLIIVLLYHDSNQQLRRVSTMQPTMYSSALLNTHCSLLEQCCRHPNHNLKLNEMCENHISGPDSTVRFACKFIFKISILKKIIGTLNPSFNIF